MAEAKSPNAVTEDATGLRGNYLTFPSVLAQSVATIGPSPAAAIAPALIFAMAGNGTWLSILIAGAGSVLVAMTVVYFARQLASSGSLYTYAAASLGPLGGLMTGWGLLLAYGISAPAAVVIFEIYADRAIGLPENGLIHTALYLGVSALAVAFALRDVKFSSRLALVIEGISMTLLISLAFIVLIHHGFRLDLTQLSLRGTSFTGIREGLVLAGGMFAGFEGAAVLGSEAKNPHRTIPLAILSSVLIVGAFFVLMAYTETLGFENSGTSFAQSPAPLNDLARIVGVAWLGRFIDTGLTVGIFAGVLGALNASSRILFTMARDGILPSALGRAHPHYQTPYIALAVVAVPTFVVPFLFVLARTKVEDVLGFLGTWGEYGFLVAYPLTSIAAGFYLYQMKQLRPHHVLVCVLAAGLMLFVFAGQLYPVPPRPYNIFPYVLVAYMLLGLLFYAVLRARAPHLAARIGNTVDTKKDAALPGTQAN